MKRLMLVAMCIFAIPLFTHRLSPPGGMAMAGHVLPGGAYCGCGAEGCTCDPGEEPPAESRTDDARLLDHATIPSDTGSDPGAGLLMVTISLLLWIRMRA